MDFFMD